MIEVEYKYAVESIETVTAELDRLNAAFVETVHQKDVYFDHLHDNFKEKDIAFRIRSCQQPSGSPLGSPLDSITWLTYKGPNQDPIGKIREEHEIRLENESASETLEKILTGVGFRPVVPVQKERGRYRLGADGFQVEFCLDQVEGLGAFAEIEILVEEQSQVEQAKATITRLAQQFGLSQPIRTSYLDLLLERS